MGEWRSMPLDLLANIYSYLSKRDRLACFLVCQRWREGLDAGLLWRKMVVYIDTDLREPSTVLLLRNYCTYVTNLEFGWSVPYRNRRWQHEIYKELIKRAVRFLLILHDSCIQIEVLKVFNWIDFNSFQKVTYHFCRFLKNQTRLKTIRFENVNMHNCSFAKLLSSCLGSKNTVVNLDVRGCYFHKTPFESIYFKSCVEQLSYLTTFKLDYFILSCQLIDSILVSRNQSLEHLEVVLKETIWQAHAIDDTQWVQLCSVCPKLKVTLIIRNFYHYGELKEYLTQGIPVVSLSFIVPRVLDDTGGECKFRKSLNWFVIKYYRTLGRKETVHLHLRNDDEDLDETLLMMMRKCAEIKTFVFNGYMENLQKLKNFSKKIAYFCTPPCGFPEKGAIFSEVTDGEIEEKKHRRVELKLLRRKQDTNCSLYILN